MDSAYTSSDSSICFATTRSFYPNQQGAFLSTAIAEDSTLRFFTVYFNGNKWRAVPRHTLSAALGKGSISKDMVVYTEGDGKTFPDNVDRSTRLSRLYGIQVIFFDWPSRVPGYGTIKNVRNTARNTRRLGKQFTSLLLLLQAYKQNEPGRIAHLTLFFHSMGNAVFRNAIEKIGTAGLHASLADNLILNAACTPRRGHRHWLEQLHFQDHIYVMYNRKDKTLREASVLFHQHLLGCSPGRHLAVNAVYLNIHELAGNNHNYFLIIPLLKEHPGILEFYDRAFHMKP